MQSNENDTDNSKEVSEFLRNLLLVGKGHVSLICGSAFELPIQYVMTNATDVDIMYIPTDLCALPVNVSAPQHFQGKTLVVTTEGMHSGFARLCSLDCNLRYRRQESILKHHYKNGPAWTSNVNSGSHIDIINSVFKNLDSSQCRGIYRRLLEMKMDRVYAICCPYWPKEADEWKTRDRPNGWPPTDVVDKVVASGCYFVAKPHQSCPEDDTQWRFSFSHAELILIHSWTDVQKYIYHILRLIKSDVVKACGGSDETFLCTYFFKTLMFWECERKPKDFWEDEHIENCVRELLCIMIGWLIDGCCPNYFIPNSNMISTLTERAEFTKETQLLLIYTKSCMTLLTLWPKAYPKHAIGQMQVLIPEKARLYVYLVLVRDNYFNPVYPKTKTHMMKQLTERNCLLWRKASDLYKGILNHLQFMKTCCPMEKCHIKRVALNYFISSLRENVSDCLKRYISIGESIYEGLERFSTAADCEIQSGGAYNDIRNDSCDLNTRGNCQQSPIKTSLPRNAINTQGRFVRCYSRLGNGEKDDVDSEIKSNAAIDILNAFIQSLLLNVFANGVDNIRLATRVICLAYLTNFYYTALQDYNKVSALCDAVIAFPKDKLRDGNLSFPERAFPIFITNELSSIFDEHFRTVLGLITLHRSIVDSLSDSSTVLVRIRPVQLIKYLKMQCKRCEGLDKPEISENFKLRHIFNEWRDTYEPLSETFMLAVLHASRCRQS